jgi:hypothetical protein
VSDTITDLGIDLESLLGDQRPDECAHIIRRQGELGAGALIMYAAEHGLEVEALCGRRWVPQGFAPDDLPACRRCVAIWEKMTGATT